MPRIEVSVSGPSIEAVCRWDGQPVPLTRFGNEYTAQLDTAAGAHHYVVSAWGSVGEQWTATVRRLDPLAERDHQGVMGPQGQDSTGHQAFKA